MTGPDTVRDRPVQDCDDHAQRGPDDPNQLVPVAAGELFESAWLADWLDHADQATRADFDRFFCGLRSPDKVALFLSMISERIAALLDGDRGQP